MSNSSLSFSEIALRLLCAFVTGVFLGLEREVHGRPAGLRTTVLACVAAAMAMILSEYFALSHSATAASIIRSDPSRLAAGVLSGIGFLGAGTIFRSGSLVRGVTTAAVLWFSTMLGLVFGSGYWVLGFCGLILAGFTLIILPVLDTRVPRNTYTRITITTNEAQTDFAFLQQIIAQLPVNVVVFDVSFSYDLENSRRVTSFDLRFERAQLFQVAQLLTKEVKSLPGVLNVRWENRSGS